ncbi:MAG TPA: alkaline phosphatase family protein, partial [Terriglobales bacterium]|nr:alkaline phosphatase family protein [Terriglobales bacterium]
MSGTGNVTSKPKGINCPTTCKASFNQGTKITLTATPGSGSAVDSWGAPCSGNSSSCTFTLNSNETVAANFRKADISLINHVIILLQENRSFDHYLGHLGDYWSANGYSAEPFDGEPSDASNPGTDGSTVSAYHLATTCVENPSPSWNESHGDWNHEDPTSSTAKLDGFIRTAATERSPSTGLPYNDSKGVRAMGYYTDRELL